MLSDAEKQELLELSRSAALREDFRRLRSSRAPLSPKEYLDFLTAFSKLFPAAPRPPKEYKRPLL